VVRFIEDNWLDGQRLGGGSFDATSGSIMGMFDFNRPGFGHDEQRKLFVDPSTGEVVDKAPNA
jgi:phospholipase C